MRSLGRANWVLRLADLAFFGAELLAVVSILRRIDRRAGIPIALLTLVAGHAALGYFNTAQPDEWSATLIAWSVALVIARRDATWWHYALAGACIGVASLEKPFFATFGILPLLCAWETAETRVRSSLATLAGAALPVVACAAWLAAHDSLGTAVDVYLRFNSQVYAQTGTRSWPMRFVAFPRLLLMQSLAAAIPLAIVGWIRRGDDAGERSHWRVVVIAWIAFGTFWLLVQARFWAYQWLPLYPAVAVLCGAGWVALDGVRTQAARVTVGVLTTAAFLIACAPGAAWPAMYVRDRVLGSVDQWDAHFAEYGPRQGYLTRVAEYVRSHANAGEAVLVWGMEPVIYASSGRLPPTRFGVSIPLVVARDSVKQHEERAEFMRALEGRPPVLLVVLDNDRNAILMETSRASLQKFVALREFVAQRYRQEIVIGDATIYRLVR